MRLNENEPKHYNFNAGLLCGAKVKNGNGMLCSMLAVRGKRRCNNHGGAKGSGAQVHNKKSLKHGHTTQDAKDFRKIVKVAIHESKKMINALSKKL